MNDPPDHLDDALLDLLNTERARPGPPAAAKTLVKARLSSSLAKGGLTRSAGARAAVLTSRRLAPASSLAVAFVTGGVVGAALHAWLSVPIQRDASLLPATTVPVAATPVPLLPPSIEILEPSPPAVSGARETRAAESDLSAERALLDRARAALGRGDNGECLRFTKAHVDTFARGRLAEEREALAVKALANLGRAEEARDRGARFRARYPRSLLLPAVERALDSIP